MPVKEQFSIVVRGQRVSNQRRLSCRLHPEKSHRHLAHRRKHCSRSSTLRSRPDASHSKDKHCPAGNTCIPDDWTTSLRSAPGVAGPSSGGTLPDGPAPGSLRVAKSSLLGRDTSCESVAHIAAAARSYNTMQLPRATVAERLCRLNAFESSSDTKATTSPCFWLNRTRQPSGADGPGDMAHTMPCAHRPPNVLDHSTQSPFPASKSDLSRQINHMCTLDALAARSVETVKKKHHSVALGSSLADCSTSVVAPQHSQRVSPSPRVADAPSPSRRTWRLPAVYRETRTIHPCPSSSCTPHPLCNKVTSEERPRTFRILQNPSETLKIC